MAGDLGLAWNKRLVVRFGDIISSDPRRFGNVVTPGPDVDTPYNSRRNVPPGFM